MRRGLAVVLCCVALGAPALAHEPITTKVTWSREVVRILSQRCSGCHSPGGMAMSLATYEEARPWAKAIKEEVLEQRMPPWYAAKGFGDFGNDPTLTPIEMELLVDWVEGGAPKGEDRDLPSYAKAPEGMPSKALAPEGLPAPGPAQGLGDPDLLLQAPGASTRLKQSRWITAWEFRPGDSSVTQAEFWIGAEYLGNWVPPEGPTVLPEGVGQLLPAGARVSIKGGPGQLRLYFAKKPPPRRLRHLRLSRGSTPLAGRVELLALRPEHSSGQPMEITARRPDGTVEVLGLFRDSQKDYEPTYRFRTPLPLPKGASIRVRAKNSASAVYLDYAEVPVVASP